MENSVEKTGETVEQAIDDALMELGADKDDVDIEVLTEKKGFLGLGGKEVSVRVSLKQDTQKVTEVSNFVIGLLEAMSFEGYVKVNQIGDRLEVNINGPDMGLLIGRKGETMDALQTIVSAVATKIMGTRTYVTVDIEGYKERRKEKLEEMAISIASTVSQTNRTTALRSMPAFERRIIHMALQDSNDVTTASEGDEPERRVLIIPKGHESE